MNRNVLTIAKAITGAAVAFTGALAIALADGELTTGEWFGVAATTLTALGAVWVVPNVTP